MYAASQEFLAAVKHSHTKIHRLDVILADEDTFSLDVAAGGVDWGIDDTVRTAAKLEVVDPNGELVPENAEDLLSPFSSRLALQRGIRFPDGTEELVPLGRVRPVVVEAGWKQGAPVIRLECYDESTRAQEPMTRPVAINAGTPVHQAIPKILVDRVPTLTFRMTETPFTTPSLLIPEDSNGWDEAMELANSAGCDLYIDRDLEEDVCTMNPRALEAAGDVVQHFVEGPECIFFDPKRRQSSDQVPNVVIVVGTHSGLGSGGVRGEAWDDDPNSPTYRYGPYGEKVKTIRSDKVASREHATTMARGHLARVLGPSDEITVSAVPNPALSLGDTTMATCARLGLNQRRVLVTRIAPMPLPAKDHMVVTLRRSVLTADDETPLVTT